MSDDEQFIDNIIKKILLRKVNKYAKRVKTQSESVKIGFYDSLYEIDSRF